jgi:pSer/pThr/pTyr-binding forkhead associated (FHA) protein
LLVEMSPPVRRLAYSALERGPRLRVAQGDAARPSLILGGPSARWVVGRALGADLVLYDPDASREHFEVVRSMRGDYLAQDLGSKNGLFVNGVRGRGYALSPGDELRAGATLLRFEE